MKAPKCSFYFVAGLLVLAVTASFWPVTRGSFLFDDFANLAAIGEYGAISDFEGLLRYLTSGIADPLGRPVAMASFLADARNWPADPEPFLRSNVLLHLLNGALLGFVLARLGALAGLAPSLRASAAALSAAIWALHPLWVSTVGYVVQRHAMLAATFVLLGIWAWTCALAAFRQEQPIRGWLWAALAMPVCGVLAALSKANGMLLPVLALALQYFLLSRPGAATPGERLAVRLVLVLPSLALLGALALSIDPEPAGRPWTLAERLLSQPRALADYLLHLVVPRVNSMGLFADGFAVSTSLGSPATTFPALAFLVALVVAVFALKRRHPYFSGAVAFYLAGHLMESSVLPLELYFEHRNYLPAMLLGWPLVLHLLSHPWQARTGRPILGLLVVILAVTTYQRASLWADTPRQAAVWALLQPASARAQTWAAQYEAERGDLTSAEARLQEALEKDPRNLMLALNLLDVQCASGRLPVASIDRVEVALSQTGAGNDMAQAWLRQKIQGLGQFCPSLEAATLARLLEASALAAQDSARAVSRQRRLEAMLALDRGDCRGATRRFNAAQRAQRWASEAYSDAAQLASRCGPETGLAYLDAFLASNEPDAKERFGMLRVHQWVLRQQGYWRDELLRLRSILRQEVEMRGRSRPESANPEPGL